MSKPATVAVLAIDMDNGSLDTTIYPDADTAFDGLLEHVAMLWEDDERDGEPPTDAEGVTEFFDEGDNGAYTITEVDLPEGYAPPRALTAWAEFTRGVLGGVIAYSDDYTDAYVIATDPDTGAPYMVCGTYDKDLSLVRSASSQESPWKTAYSA